MNFNVIMHAQQVGRPATRHSLQMQAIHVSRAEAQRAANGNTVDLLMWLDRASLLGRLKRITLEADAIGQQETL